MGHLKRSRPVQESVGNDSFLAIHTQQLHHMVKDIKSMRNPSGGKFTKIVKYGAL
jgi:hypothetical protein